MSNKGIGIATKNDANQAIQGIAGRFIKSFQRMLFPVENTTRGSLESLS